MTIPYLFGLFAFLAVVAVLLVRFVTATVDREFSRLARAAEDSSFRREELARADAALEGCLPLPADTVPLPPPGSPLRGAAAPVLAAVGVILLWGAGAVREDGATWLAGGLAALAVAGGSWLLAGRQRRRERIARRLRFRADLRRLDDDRAGAAEDCRQLLLLMPWDDAAWAELAEDREHLGNLAGALDAIQQAVLLDPEYSEYRLQQAVLATRLGQLDVARAALQVWQSLERRDPDDPRLVECHSALDAAERRSQAAGRSAAALDRTEGEPP